MGSFSRYIEPSNPSPAAPKKSQGRAENLDSIRTPYYKFTQSVASLRQLSEYPGTLSELDWNGCPNSSESAAQSPQGLIGGVHSPAFSIEEKAV